MEKLEQFGTTAKMPSDELSYRLVVLVLLMVLLGSLSLSGCSKSSSGASGESGSSQMSISSASAISSSEKSSAAEKAVDHGSVTSIEAVYNGPTAPGTTIDSESNITVTATYEDGYSENVDGWKVKKEVELEEATESTVVVKYKKKTAEILVMGDIPSEYASAARKAQSYVDTMYMSKVGLYDQLTSEYGEQFSEAAADYAIEHVNADWEANALQKARSYRDTMAMSPSSIHEQLTSDYGEKFTQEEADYAIEHLDDDQSAGTSGAGGEDGDDVPTEYKTALRKAQSYAETMHMSKAGLYDQLTSEYGEKYSAEAAEYAVENVDVDWGENALEKARSYRDMMDMSPDAIYDQLTSDYGEKFTAEEADYAIAHLDD